MSRVAYIYDNYADLRINVFKKNGRYEITHFIQGPFDKRDYTTHNASYLSDVIDFVRNNMTKRGFINILEYTPYVILDQEAEKILVNTGCIDLEDIIGYLKKYML